MKIERGKDFFVDLAWNDPQVTICINTNYRFTTVLQVTDTIHIASRLAQHTYNKLLTSKVFLDMPLWPKTHNFITCQYHISGLPPSPLSTLKGVKGHYFWANLIMGCHLA